MNYAAISLLLIDPPFRAYKNLCCLFLTNKTLKDSI